LRASARHASASPEGSSQRRPSRLCLGKEFLRSRPLFAVSQHPARLAVAHTGLNPYEFLSSCGFFRVDRSNTSHQACSAARSAGGLIRVLILIFPACLRNFPNCFLDRRSLVSRDICCSTGTGNAVY